jgi:CO/xanthine dehydrogenase FAD-binding subunit
VIDPESAAAAATASMDGVRPTGDIHGSSEYRHGLTRSLVERAILSAGQNVQTSAAEVPA